MSAVTWGRRNRYRFTAGGSLKDWQPVGGAAIYAVTYKPDAVSRPKGHTVVYFGETPDLLQQSASIRTDLDAWWNDNGGIGRELFIFFHDMAGSSQFERGNLHHQLVAEYDPIGNN